MENTSPLIDYPSFFKTQTVFLTGGTGGLGGCVLYKLSLELPTRKIYVLCRSKEKAKESWTKSMPNQANAILSSKNVELVVGDITKPNFGISKDMLAEIESRATMIIHSAASISFMSSIRKAVTNNCLPPLELARMASKFQNLQHFVQVSTAYTNSHLPDGSVEEKLYEIGDPEVELQDILTTGSSEFANQFPWPYAYAKNLMERLLFLRFPELPLLIIRPSRISAAVYHPYPLYGPIESLPTENAFQFLLADKSNKLFHATEGSTSGTNVYDEIPVDWVSNLILLHAVVGTKGVAHASAESYIPRTFDDLYQSLCESEDRHITFVTDRSVEQCDLAKFYKVSTRDWRFSGASSNQFRQVEGPLSIQTKDIDMNDMDRKRKAKVYASIPGRVSSKL